MNMLEAVDCQITDPSDLPASGPAAPPIRQPESTRHFVSAAPPRPAWLEIDLGQLRRNFNFINRDKPAGVAILSVIKDEAYGHGALRVAQIALQCGVRFLAVATIQEAVTLRDAGIQVPILLLGDRHEEELPWCLEYNLTCCVSDPETARKLGCLAARANSRIPVHLKINTGMNRYGAHWEKAAPLIDLICRTKSLLLEGLLSHFALAGEADKNFALLQLSRFNEVLDQLERGAIHVKLRHLCNSGGFLDLPQAHFDMLRLGILPLGVYPSAVCRRIPGIAPIMTVKTRIAAIHHLEPGDRVGYGMHYTASERRRLAVLPVGYGDGFPRVQGRGCVLIGGRRAPLVGSVAMDALTVDVTEIPEARMGDEAVLMGRQGSEEISVHEIARLKNSVSYDVLTSWRSRLPRIYLDKDDAQETQTD